jgi:hypothetical protein
MVGYEENRGGEIRGVVLSQLSEDSLIKKYSTSDRREPSNF